MNPTAMMSRKVAAILATNPASPKERQLIAADASTATSWADLSGPVRALLAEIETRGRPDGPHRSALIASIVSAQLRHLLDIDDEPIGELDEPTLALLTAMSELDQEPNGARSWDPALHPRDPSGRFRTIIDRLKAAIR